MKKMAVINLCICAAMVALHIVLEVFCTVRIGNDLKISFSTLPFIFTAMMCGPVEGMLTALTGTLLSQIITYGITITTPFWVLPGVVQALAAGLIYKGFGRRTKLIPVGVTIAVSCFVLVIFNLFASYMDGVVIYKYWTIEALIAVIPFRLLVYVGIVIVYTAVAMPIYKVVQTICPGDLKRGKQNRERNIDEQEN
ncbi:MAG: ECF transporter S component [Lachnospiraceae bacterium]|jgi:ECF transporter S component (folate family)